MQVIQGTKKGKAKMKGSRLQKCSAGKKYIYATGTNIAININAVIIYFLSKQDTNNINKNATG